MAVIAEERRSQESPAMGRTPATTQHYGDRISNAPGATSPKTSRALDGAPEISVTFSEAGRETIALIEEEEHLHGSETARAQASSTASEPVSPGKKQSPAPKSATQLASLEIEQIHTFRVHASVEQFQSEAARQQLVHHRLLRQMPACGPGDINRIEIKKGIDADTIFVRVWTRVP